MNRTHIKRIRRGKKNLKMEYVKKCEKCEILLSRSWEGSLCLKCGSTKEETKTAYDKLCEDLKARGVLL